MPRRIETLIYGAQARILCNEKDRACQLAEFALQKAMSLGMRGWAMDALAILAKHSKQKVDFQHQLEDLLAQLSAQLNPSQTLQLRNRF